MSLDETVTVFFAVDAGASPVAVEVPRRIGHVKIGEMLGQGTSGAVYAAYDEALGRRVAVKLLTVAEGEGGLSELVAGARAAAGIKHPNIVGVHTVEIVNGVPVIVMERIDGVSLRELLVRLGALDPALALLIAREVAAGVSVLHEQSVVHRDLKPANVLFDHHGACHVCDFGLACSLGERTRVIGTSRIGGSPLYMAPEAFNGVVSPQSDVYALGVLLFEMLSGKAPFDADSMSGMRRCHESTAVPWELLSPLNLPDEVKEVIERALHKQRIMRYKSAAHFLRALECVSVPGPHESILRQRISSAVSANAADVDALRTQMHEERPPATTFDLLADRARRKRSGLREGEDSR